MSQEVLYVMPSEKVQPRKYCCLLLNELSKGINIVNQEFQRLQMLENEYNKKLQTYLEVSKRVDKKLCNLWDISSRIIQNDYNRAMEIYTFTNKIIRTWQEGNATIAKDVQNVLLVSFTNPNAPLKVVIEKILANSSISRDAYQKISPHIFCMGRFNSIYSQALPLFGRLRNGNLILQYFLSISRGIPHLTSLENSVDQYVLSSLPASLLPQVYLSGTGTASATSSIIHNPAQTKPENDDLSAYSRVVQLLNGELLAEKNPLHHHSNITPLVSHEYILPDIIPEIPNAPETNGDIRNKPNLQSETTKETRGAFGNEFSPNETTISVLKAPQKGALGVSRNEGQRSIEVMLRERPTATNSKAMGSSSLTSSATNLIRPKMVFQVNDRKDFNRRRQIKLDAENSDLKPIKIPKLKIELLTPLP